MAVVHTDRFTNVRLKYPSFGLITGGIPGTATTLVERKGKKHKNIKVYIFNNHETEPLRVRAGDRLGMVVFMKDTDWFNDGLPWKEIDLDVTRDKPTDAGMG